MFREYKTIALLVCVGLFLSMILVVNSAYANTTVGQEFEKEATQEDDSLTVVPEIGQEEANSDVVPAESEQGGTNSNVVPEESTQETILEKDDNDDITYLEFKTMLQEYRGSVQFRSPFDEPEDSAIPLNPELTRGGVADLLTNELRKNSSFDRAYRELTGYQALVPVAEYFSGELTARQYPSIMMMMGTGLMGVDAEGKFNYTSSLKVRDARDLIIKYLAVETGEASDYKQLDELREVAQSGTNFNAFGKMNLKMRTGDAFGPINPYASIPDIFGKKINLRQDLADVFINRMIFVDPVPHNGVVSVYKDLFHLDGPDTSGYVRDYSREYRIFIEHDFVSKEDGLSAGGKLANLGSETNIGAQLYHSNVSKYGGNAYVFRDSRDTYNAGEGEKNIWSGVLQSKSSNFSPMIFTADMFMSMAFGSNPQ